MALLGITNHELNLRGRESTYKFLGYENAVPETRAKI